MLKINLIFFLLIKIFSYAKTTFKQYAEISNIILTNADNECKFCSLYRFKIKEKENITFSTPRLYNSSGSIVYGPKFTTLVTWKQNENEGKLKVWPDHYIMHYPENDRKSNYKLYSIMGFTIDDDKFYLLDQGKINYENNTVEIKTPKVVIMDPKKERKDDIIYQFNESEYTNSLLTDITVDHDGKYIYIVDSGNLLNKQSVPGIIVINLEDGEINKVLHNHSSFKSEEYLNLENIKITPEEYFSKAVGVNTIQISCDDETLYYSSQKSKNIYSVSTKDIHNAIKKYKDSKNINDLKDIEVNKANQNFLNQDLVLSSKNNVYMINKQSHSVELSYYLDDDLAHFNYNLNSKIVYNETINPISLDLYNGHAYLLENVINNNYGNYTYKIYIAELEKDELDNNVGCTVFVFKLYGSLIFLFILFLMILGITILIIIVNSGNKLEKSHMLKEMEKEENINELNRELNEKKDE